MDTNYTHEMMSPFREHTTDLATNPPQTVAASAERLRRLLVSGTFGLADLQREPRRFFDAHRHLSAYALDAGPGFGIRMTVQYNLFAGTVLALGNAKQRARLDAWQRDGTLGCFALTEAFAGVHSGLVVHTTATWDQDTGGFVLHTPNDGAVKNWISQGTVAEWCVLVATLVDGDGVARGPHGFLVRLRRPDGTLASSRITIASMPMKSVGRDLDNARLTFDRALLERDALLDAHAHVTATGKYVTTRPGVRPLEIMAQRLHTGRAVIATSALVFAQTLFARTKAYLDAQTCWSPAGEHPLSALPQLASLYADATTTLGQRLAQMAALEHEMVPHLRRNALLPKGIAAAVAAGKVLCIEESIDLCHRLQQEVGSYALMVGTGFEHLGYLQCCKFAEGDSRVLMQKLARDRVRDYLRGEDTREDEDTTEEERLCDELAHHHLAHLGTTTATSTTTATAREDAWRLPYELATRVGQRLLASRL